VEPGGILGWLLSLFCALLLLAAILLFGGIFLPEKDKAMPRTQEVELLGQTEKEKPKPEETKPEKQEDMDTDADKAPALTEEIKDIVLAPPDDGPALDAASLSAIEAALNGEGAGGFGSAMSFESGGHIGGTGKGNALDQSLENAFNPAEIDQKPRAVFQTSPIYPPEMRGKKVEGQVVLIFVVDADGRVSSPRIESTSHQAFSAPALNAIKKWKFEPGLRAGQRVACKMRAPIRFPAE
jgi:TonB family protein